MTSIMTWKNYFKIGCNCSYLWDDSFLHIITCSLILENVNRAFMLHFRYLRFNWRYLNWLYAMYQQQCGILWKYCMTKVTISLFYMRNQHFGILIHAVVIWLRILSQAASSVKKYPVSVQGTLISSLEKFSNISSIILFPHPLKL